MLALPILNQRPLASPAAPPRSVRISITDRCDLACVYCRPSRSEHYMESRMSLAEFRTMLAGLREAGIERVRITGGEPLVHPDPTAFIAAIAEHGFTDVALTTNATRLAELAKPLKAAGLTRVNISIDSLDETRFFRLTRGGSLARVMKGIEAALAAGFSEMKTNTVVVKDENEDELGALTEWAWSHGMTPRFLEIMSIGEGAKMKDRVVSYGEMRARLAHLLIEDAPARDANRGPAKYVASRTDATKRAGFITGTTDTYCKGCDRLRVSADGMLRPCLATDDGVSGRAAANIGAKEVAREVARAWEKKPDGEIFRGCTEDSAAQVSIRKIGG